MTCIGKWEELSNLRWRYSVDGKIKGYVLYDHLADIWRVKVGDKILAEFIPEALEQAKQFVEYGKMK